MRYWKLIIAVELFLIVSILIGGCSTELRNENLNSESSEVYLSFVVDTVDDNIAVEKERVVWTGGSFKKENMEEQSCVVLGTRYEGKYNKSVTDITNSYTTDRYYTDDDIEFGLRSDTGELCYLDLMNYDYFDTEPYLNDVENPEETAIALSKEIAQKYLPDMEKYEQIVKKSETLDYEREGQTYQLTHYMVTYVKKFHGYDSSDHITISVSSKGHLTAIVMGDIGAFDDAILELESNKIDESIYRKAQEVFEKTSLESRYKLLHSNIVDQTLVKTPDGEIGMYSYVRAEVKDISEVEDISNESTETLFVTLTMID